mmetsp:Transcript_16812/g.20181  ORF Transcript_16812/g.20181 Transcript_16812/m.20181 type:complete len:81 (+) Transcript_16812:38-280(+)
MQELETASSCVREIFPDAKITSHCGNKYPIRVTITFVDADGNKSKIWTGKQQLLFAKNAADRTRSMNEIKSNLKDLQSKL